MSDQVTTRRQVKVTDHTPIIHSDPGKAVRDSVMASGTGVKTPELESGQIALILRNGTEVILGPPKTGIMVQMAHILVEQPDNTMLFMLVRALMYIRSINGKPINMPENMTDVRVLCNNLGPDGEDEVIMAYAQNWPPLTFDSLKIIKK